MSACVCISRKTGFHFPALDGTEAVIEFRDGDPDKPYIAAFHHNSQAVDHITNDRRWLSRNVIRTQSNNKLRMEDWACQESIKLSTEYGKSQLNLGYLVDNKLGKRGEGFELRTDNYGMVRAGRGLFLSANAQNRAAGQALDMQVAMEQLETAAMRMKSLSDAVQQAKAVVAACEEQKRLLDEQVSALKQAVLLASAPQGMALTSGGLLQLAAGGHLFATAGGNVDTGAGSNYTVAARNSISLFAGTQGMKLYAGKGKVEVQAQGDAMSLLADRDVHIASMNEKVSIAAAKELVLECGGAFIQLKDGSVTIGGPLDLFIKTITIQKQGKAQMNLPVPLMPATEGEEGEQYFILKNHDGVPVADRPYRILTGNGTIEGRTDHEGKTRLVDGYAGQGVHFEILPENQSDEQEK